MKMKDTLLEIQHLKEENQRLKVDNDFLERQNKALKMRCSKYCLEISTLQRELNDMKFTQKLLEPLTDDEQIEQSLEKAENHYYEMGTALYGDDF